MIVSQSNPNPTDCDNGTPNRPRKAARAISLTPSPPRLMGIIAASFANGHAKNQTWRGRSILHSLANMATKNTKFPCISTARKKPRKALWGFFNNCLITLRMRLINSNIFLGNMFGIGSMRNKKVAKIMITTKIKRLNKIDQSPRSNDARENKAPMRIIRPSELVSKKRSSTLPTIMASFSPLKRMAKPARTTSPPATEGKKKLQIIPQNNSGKRLREVAFFDLN